jgi:hypothetical protein
MFDAPSQRYPKKWKEMSLDFKRVFAHHGCMMALFIAGQTLSVREEILVYKCLGHGLSGHIDQASKATN